MTKYNRWAQ